MIWGNSNNGSWRLGVDFIVTQETDTYIDIRAELWIWTKYATWERTNSLTVGTIDGSWSYSGSTYGFSVTTNRAWSENNRARIWDSTKRFDKNYDGFNVNINASLTGVNYPNTRFRESVSGSMWVGRKNIGVPDAPRNLHATWINDNTITLNWQNTNPYSQSNPYQTISVTVVDENNGNWYEIAAIGIDESYTWRNAEVDRSYIFAVRPVNRQHSGDVAYSNTVKTRPSATSRPVITSSVSETIGDPSTVNAKLIWGYPSNRNLVPSSYNVSWTGPTSGQTTSSTREATIIGIKSDSDYEFKVNAVSTGDGTPLTGPWSLPTKYKTSSVPKTAPAVSITGTLIHGLIEPRNTILSLSWTRVASATAYRVVGGESEMETSATSCDLAGLLPGKSYSIKVFPINDIGTGPSSSPVIFVAPDIPSTPVISSFYPTATGLRISISAALPNGSNIFRYEYMITVGEQIVTPWTRMLATSFDAPVSTGRVYRLHVRAVNSVGTGPEATMDSDQSGGYVWIMKNGSLVKKNIVTVAGIAPVRVYRDKNWTLTV